MSFVCTNCGEKESFKREVSGSVYFDRTDYIDSESGITDYGDYDYGEDYADTETIFCAECESTNIEDLDGDDWENFDIEHYRETGEYYDNIAPTTWKEKMKKVIGQ